MIIFRRINIMKQFIREIISATFLIIGTISVCGQSFYPGQFKDKMGVLCRETPAECFELKDVKLLPGRFYDNLRRDSAWLISIPVERLLHSFYNNSGVWGGKEGGYMTVAKLGGWESLDCELRGHTTGHILSALALMFAATEDDIFKTKADSIVNGLDKVQLALGNGYLSAFPEELINRNLRGEAVWAPWYTLHKILAGLIDQYLYCGNLKAFKIARGMGDWAFYKLNGIEEATRARMLRNEFGGINESFYNLYALTGDERYKNLAEFFYHNEVIDPLKAHNSDFGTKHTNTFIPKVIGEIRKYELTGYDDSRDLSVFFWNEMMRQHIYPTGALSDKEHFFPPNEFSKHITGYTGETCCTYNMLKLARHLFCITPDSRIFDYYERGLYNHILGQQDTETGMVAYFLPIETGTHKVYSTPENSFWCCVGSGFESHAKYAESVYFKSSDKDTLYINLFIPTALNWEERSLKLLQENNFPSFPSSTLTILDCDNRNLCLNIRKPTWAKAVEIKINGKKQSIHTTSNGYISIERKWKKGDRVEINFDMPLRVESAPAENLMTVFYGPVLLAGRLGSEGILAPAPFSNPSLYNDYYTYDYNIPEGIDRSLGLTTLKRLAPLSWQTADGTILEPLYDIHRERYQIYWDTLPEE